MNKQQLIDAVSEKTSTSKSSAEAAINALTEIISDQISQGEEVTLHGLGKFKVKQRKARTGRNPATGEPLAIAASKAVTFTVAKQLKDAVNG